MTFYSPPENTNEKEQRDMTNLWEYVPHNSHHNFGEIDNRNIEIENKEHSKEVIVEPVKFSVIGLLMTAEFQKCKYIAEGLRRSYPEKYQEPVIVPMMNLEWNEFLLNERRSKGGASWALKEPVAVYHNDEFMGDHRTLTKYVSSRYILPMKNFFRSGRTALKNHIMDIINQGRSCIYLMISIDKVIIGTMLFMLYDDLVPNTCRLFVKRCRQVKGGYTGTPIHRIVTPSWIQCGGYRLKEVVMPCENYAVCHDKRGVLSMCNSGNHKKNTTQFMITLEKTSWMDTHYVAFGISIFEPAFLPYIFLNIDRTSNTSAQLLNISEFNENEILMALKNVKPKKTSGPDDILAFIFKDCAYTLPSSYAVFQHMHKIAYDSFSVETIKSMPSIQERQLLHGDWVLNQIESVPTYYQAPKKEVKIVKAGEYSLQPSKLIPGTTELQSFLDKRLKLKPKSYQNYSTIDELKLEKIVQQNENKREYLDTDLRPYFPLEMLPENILESFNYVPDKKSSCLFEVENCTKCGCSHDVGKCLRDSSSRSSISS